MQIKCEVPKELWGNLNNWIIKLGMENFNSSNEKIVVGNLENA